MELILMVLDKKIILFHTWTTRKYGDQTRILSTLWFVSPVNELVDNIDLIFIILYIKQPDGMVRNHLRIVFDSISEKSPFLSFFIIGHVRIVILCVLWRWAV